MLSRHGAWGRPGKAPRDGGRSTRHKKHSLDVAVVQDGLHSVVGGRLFHCHLQGLGADGARTLKHVLQQRGTDTQAGRVNIGTEQNSKK